jgi:hypothetical protein
VDEDKSVAARPSDEDCSVTSQRDEDSAGIGALFRLEVEDFLLPDEAILGGEGERRANNKDSRRSTRRSVIKDFDSERPTEERAV